MQEKTRRHLLGNVRRAVLKIGNLVLTERPVARIRALAADIAQLREGGIDVVIITSGSISMGMSRLDLKRRPRQLPLLQAAGAVGQVALMQAYEDALAAYRIPVGEVLLTRADLEDPAHFLRARHTLMALLDFGVVPVVNENDALAVDEILLGDNDTLAAGLPRLVEADLLAVLTTAEGIFAAHPRRGGEVISLVEDIDALAARVDEGASKGKIQRSLASKVRLAQQVAQDGIPTLIASGLRPGVLSNLLDDDSIGTLLLPRRHRRSRKRWIAEDVSPKGQIQVSEQVRQSLIEGRRSLPPAAAIRCSGTFSAGDVVEIVDETGPFARGLVGYTRQELERLQGQEPAELDRLLGSKPHDEVIRRDDLVIL